MFKEQLVTEKNIDLVIDMWHKIFPEEQLWCGYECAKNCFEKSLNPDDFLKYYIHFDSTPDKPMGFPVGISGIYTENAEPESAWLGWFGVLPEYRRQRYGTRIMNFFLRQCRDFGFKYARLYTGAENIIGQKFYEFNGFTGEPIHIDYTDEPEYLIIYSKTLCDEPVPPWNNRHLDL